MSRKPTAKLSSGSLQAWFDESSAPVYLLDADYRLVYANAACAAWLGVPVAEMIGKRIAYSATGRDDAPTSLAQLCPPPEVFAGRLPRDAVTLVGTGAQRWQIQFTPLFNADREIAGVLALAVGSETDSGPSATIRSAQAAHEWLVRFHALERERTMAAIGIGVSSAARLVREQVRLAQSALANALVIGPAGSGRTQIARAIHFRQETGATPLATVECGDTTESLLASALDAASRWTRESGRPFTLILREIDQLPSELQIYLAQTLERTPARLRLLSTARSDLRGLARQAKFRDDLACDLSTILIAIPPLADRPDDLPVLAQHFVEQCNSEGVKQLSGFEAEALDQLLAYAWPGEARELESVVRTAHRAAEGPAIRAADLPELFRHVDASAARPRVEDEPIILDEFLEKIELELIERALARAKGNKTKAAEMLGVNRPRFYRRLVQLGLISEASDESEP